MKLLNTVVLAEDYERTRDWWIEAVGLDIIKEWPEMGYCDLGSGGEIVVGIATADSMGFEPQSPRSNATLPQLLVEDVVVLLEQVEQHGGRIAFGPSHNEEAGYWYGAFEDCEGNAVWVITSSGHDA